MASGEVQMDWEAVVPGQYEPPHHPCRKRAAEPYDFADNDQYSLSNPIPSSQDSRIGQPESGIWRRLWRVTYNILQRAFSVSTRALKITTRASASQEIQQVIEIRSISSDGVESVKRRATDVIVPSGNRTQRTHPSRRPAHRFESPSIRNRNFPPLVITARSPSATRMTTQRNTYPPPMMSQSMAEIQQDATMSGALNFTGGPEKGIAISSPSVPLDPLPGPEALSRIRSSLNPPALPGDDIHESALQTIPLVFEPAAAPRPSQMSRSHTGRLQRRSSENQYRKVKKTVTNMSKRVSNPELQDHVSQPRLSSDSQILSVHPGERHVRIALNPHNGLPQERVVKFFKESMIGEWAPSSPWSNDQVVNTQSDLDGNLLTLLQDTTSPLPPPTPPPKFTEALSLKAHSRSKQETKPIPAENRRNSAKSPRSQIQDKSEIYSSDSSDVPSRRSLFAAFAPSWLSTQSPGRGSRNVTRPAPNMVTPPVTTSGSSDPLSENHEVDPLSSIDMEHMITASYPYQSEPSLDDSAGSNEVGSGRQISESVEDGFAEKFQELAMSDSMKDKRTIRKRRREEAKAAKKAAEEAAAAKAKAEAEREALKQQTHRRMPKRKFIQTLSKDWELRIDESMRKGEHMPLTTTVNGTELRRKDLMTVLGEREWLNDEIINAYLEWIVEYANEKAGKNGRTAIPKVIAHNSFFYKKIASDGPKSVSRWMKRKRAEGKKLLEVEQVLIPVNNAAHWTLLVVSPKTRTVEYLDSFGGSSKTFITNTIAWLEAELGDAWKRDEWHVLETRSAQQYNGYDCGVFTITNAECVAGSILTDSYDARDMAAQRRRIAAVLLNRGFGGELVAGEDL